MGGLVVDSFASYCEELKNNNTYQLINEQVYLHIFGPSALFCLIASIVLYMRLYQRQLIG